jgi:hypothetical protein
VRPEDYDSDSRIEEVEKEVGKLETTEKPTN